MTITLDIDRALETVYALAALERFGRDKSSNADNQLHLLSRDEEPALRRVVCAAATNLAIALVPHVIARNLEAYNKGECLEFEAHIIPVEGDAVLLPIAFEQALAHQTLWQLGIESAGPSADKAIALIHSIVDRAYLDSKPLTTKPHYI